jgi:septal ring factor EnvC (AmiA/AmiB activator)
MPSPHPDQATATRDDVQRLERHIADLKATVARLEHDLQIQFTRTSQVQADIDLIRAAWTMVKPTTSHE